MYFIICQINKKAQLNSEFAVALLQIANCAFFFYRSLGILILKMSCNRGCRESTHPSAVNIGS